GTQFVTCCFASCVAAFVSSVSTLCFTKMELAHTYDALRAKNASMLYGTNTKRDARSRKNGKKRTGRAEEKKSAGRQKRSGVSCKNAGQAGSAIRAARAAARGSNAGRRAPKERIIS